jgi:hypothetical protein
MAKFADSLSSELQDFILNQKIFFTASAAAEGRINLSPKGMDTIRVLSDRELAYLDFTGSGNETAAHLLAANRVTFMWCSFDEKPLILRAYCTGRAVRPRDAEWPNYAQHFTLVPGARQIIVAKVQSVQTSCGFAVPRMQFLEHRPMLVEWCEKRGADGIQKYWEEKNQTSIDRLPTGLLEVEGTKS